jgi:hypothetical protein
MLRSLLLYVRLNMLPHMRTSIELPDPILKRAKRVARQRGTTLRALIEEGLRKVLDEAEPVRPFRLRDASFGQEGLVDGLTDGDWDRIRDLSYEGRGG